MSCEYENYRSFSYDTICNYFSFEDPGKAYNVVLNGRTCCVQYSILRKVPSMNTLRA